MKTHLQEHPWLQREQLTVFNSIEMEVLRNAVIYEENGLMGMKDIDGNVVRAPQYMLIAKCIDYVFFLDPKGFYEKIAEGCAESGYKEEDDRLWRKSTLII